MVRILLIIATLLPLTLSANYDQAQRALSARSYMDAAALFYQAYAFPRTASERLKAEWGLAESLYRSGYLYSASRYYSVIVRRGAIASNPFFRGAMEQLGRINSTISLGQSHIVQLFKTRINPSVIPGEARGFYFYYLGVEAYSRNRFEEARKHFDRVPQSSPYYAGAIFHLGVVNNLSGRHSAAIAMFERVLSSNTITTEMREMALLNIARVHYETTQYQRSIQFYRQIPRNSSNWLDSLWEASWAFFLMQNHNSALGNIHTIHSPFFNDRFYPETYILQAITFLRLCRYDEVRKSLILFRDRYKGTFDELKQLMSRYDRNPKGFFRLVYDYRVGQQRSFPNSTAIFDSLSRTDNYKEAQDTIRFSDSELARLSSVGGNWRTTGLHAEITKFLNSKKDVAQADAGVRLYRKAASFYAYLKELSDQTGLIQAEMLEGKLENLRSRINISTKSNRVEFIGGMQELSLAQRYEFWPFEGEYWEDELGYYVYNLESICRRQN
jgi:tetratricopeptide (TPR) repeat protein